MEQQYEALSAPGTITVVPAGVPHRPLAGGKLDYWLLGFTAAAFGLAETQPVMRPFAEVRLGSSPVLTLDVGAQERLEHWLRLLSKETKVQNDESADVQRSLITLVLAEAARAMPTVDIAKKHSSLVSKALHYIQLHSLSPISLSDVAGAVGRTIPHVASTVKSETGFTVGTWITSARVSKAAQLLRHTDMAVDQIAPQIGWQDTTHFIRQFRKIYGVTPAAWRKKMR